MEANCEQHAKWPMAWQQDRAMIVIGFGTGRSGTTSLAELLAAQKNAHCFHELNPACVRFSGTPRPIINTIDEFRRIEEGGDPSELTVDFTRRDSTRSYEQLCRKSGLRLIGDVAFYYLSYVLAIAQHNPDVLFLCLRRDIDDTVQSWIEKSRIVRWPSRYVADRLSSLIVRTPFHRSSNYWMNHDGRVWEPDPMWDKCFPKFDVKSKREAIRKYCEYYYREVEALEIRLRPRFRFVETRLLSERSYQADVLGFLGIEPEDRVHVLAHANRGENGARVPAP
jgi:Sulfotransferase family